MTDAVMDRACPHKNFDAMVIVNRLEDSGRFVVDIRIRCVDCDDPFVFVGDLPVGVDLSGVTTSLDRRELRAAIRPDLSIADCIELSGDGQ